MRRNRRMRRPRAMNIMRRRMRITEEIERGGELKLVERGTKE